MILALAVAGALSWQSQALSAEQEQPATGPGQGQGQWRQRLEEWRAKGAFDTNQARTRLADRLKTMLRASDDEWKIIQPLVEDVVAKQGAVMRGQMEGMFGGIATWFGRGSATAQPAGGQSSQRQVGAAETQALRQVVEAENAPVSEIKGKLQSYREARKKSEVALQESREKLRAVLGHRQEAQLVLLGILD